MLFQTMILLGGLALLVLGAEGLVRGSSSLALRLGLTPLVIGLTVVAFGTSAPELVVSLGASLSGHGDVALGNVVGSNIFNIGMILGLSALVCPIRIHISVIRLDVPVVIGSSFIATWFVAAGYLARFAGIGFLFALAAYVAFSIHMARKQTASADAQEKALGVPKRAGSIWLDLVLVIAGLSLLVFGARLLVSSATEMARVMGVSEAIISLTIVAAGTSLPELATSVLAALRRQPDIAVGNVVGSNIFNILGILGVSSVVAPLSAPGISRLDLGAMLAFAIALLPLLWTGRTLSRPEGVMLLVGYGVYLWVLWP